MTCLTGKGLKTRDWLVDLRKVQPRRKVAVLEAFGRKFHIRKDHDVWQIDETNDVGLLGEFVM